MHIPEKIITLYHLEALCEGNLKKKKKKILNGSLHERLDMQLRKETRTVIPWTPGYPMTERDENSYTMDAWICNDGKRREHLYCTAVHDNFIKPLQKLHFTADHVISAMD